MVSETDAPPIDWTGLKSLLRNDPEAIPWREREALVSGNTAAFAHSTDESLAILDILAEDAKWEVRRRVAELISQLPEDRLQHLAARLTEDQNAYVRKAAERSLDRRRRGQQASSRRRRMLGSVADDYEVMERLHGMLATRMSRQIAERLYDMLVGATIHNMRGLLTPVSTSSQSLLKRVSDGKTTPAELKRHLKRIVAATGDLGRLMDDVRRYSQQVPTARRRERLSMLVHEACEYAKVCCTQSGLDVNLISLQITVSDRFTVEASRVHLVSALTNLIQNALDGFRARINQGGSFVIAITGQIREPGIVDLVIEDNGIGFGEEDLRLIRQFIPGQTTLKHDGTGFGLPTAKRYIEAHGGTLEIDSQEGVGTRVSLKLPLADD